MAADTAQTEELAIIVSSCDETLDVFKEFMRYLRLNWSDCPFQLILVTPTQHFIDDRVLSITTSAETKWAERIIKGLEYTKAKYIFTMCEDAFFLKPIDTKYIIKIVKFMQKHNIKYYCNPKYPVKKKKDNSFDDFDGALKIRKDIPYSVTCFTNIWERNEFVKIFGRKNWTGWDIENYFLKVSSQSKKGYYNNYVTDKDNFLNVVETINGGCWTYETYLFEKNGISIQKGQRPDAPKSEYYRKKIHIMLNHIVPRKFRKSLKKIFSKLGYKFTTDY